jgi:hypothetical protein
VTGYGARLHDLPLERFSMTRKLAGAAIAMLLAGLAAGCGGDDGGGAGTGAAGTTTTTTAGGAATKARFVERADAVCETAAKRLNAAGAKLRPTSKDTPKLSEAQVTRFLTQHTVPSYERMLLGLRDLTPPQRDEKRFDEYLASISRAIEALKAKPGTFARLEGKNPFTDANNRAKAIGFKVCGS